jgi:hypothetical protein
MKKRGGVGKKRSRTFADSERISSIVSKEIIRPPFMEPLHGTTASKISTDGYTIDGPNTIFYAMTDQGFARFVVNTKRDEEEQHKAYDRFNHNFQSIQNYFIEKLRTNMIHKALHDGQWICVTAGKGKWYQSDGSWEMLPKIVNWSDGVDTKDDAFVKSPEGETAIFGENSKSNPTFCVPRNYDVILLTPSGARVMAMVSKYVP